MLRRSFLAAGVAAPLAPLSTSKPRRKPDYPTPHARGIVVLYRVPAGWKPSSWRDAPPAGSEVLQVGEPQSLASARKFVKFANNISLRDGAGLWDWRAVVVTDGRKAKGGPVA